jgi:hypothetical protein
VVELAVGDANDAVALREQVTVSGAVLLERPGGLVGLAAVELCDETLLRPQGVDGVGADAFVDLRAFEVVRVEEGEEGDLELASRERAAEVVLVDDLPECRCPSSSLVACEQGIEGERACEAAVLGLVNRAFESLGRELFGQVEERAGGRRDRDAALVRDLVGGQSDAVCVNAGPIAAARRADRVCPMKCVWSW